MFSLYKNLQPQDESSFVEDEDKIASSSLKRKIDDSMEDYNRKRKPKVVNIPREEHLTEMQKDLVQQSGREMQLNENREVGVEGVLNYENKVSEYEAACRIKKMKADAERTDRMEYDNSLMKFKRMKELLSCESYYAGMLELVDLMQRVEQKEDPIQLRRHILKLCSYIDGTFVADYICKADFTTAKCQWFRDVVVDVYDVITENISKSPEKIAKILQAMVHRTALAHSKKLAKSNQVDVRYYSKAMTNKSYDFFAQVFISLLEASNKLGYYLPRKMIKKSVNQRDVPSYRDKNYMSALMTYLENPKDYDELRQFQDNENGPEIYDGESQSESESDDEYY